MVIVPPVQMFNPQHVVCTAPVDFTAHYLKILAPNTKNVGVMYNPRTSRKLVKAATQAAKQEGMSIVTAKIDSPDEVADATRAFLGTIDALWMLPDQTVMNPESFNHLLKFTFKNKVPFFSVAHRLVETGALVSLSPEYGSIGGQTGKVAVRLLNDKVPMKSIPVADPEGLDGFLSEPAGCQIGVRGIELQPEGQRLVLHHAL